MELFDLVKDNNFYVWFNNLQWIYFNNNKKKKRKREQVY